MSDQHIYQYVYAYVPIYLWIVSLAVFTYSFCTCMYWPTLKTIFVMTSLCLSHLHRSFTCGEHNVDIVDRSFTMAYCLGWASSSVLNRSRRSLRFSRWSSCISFKSSKIWSVIWMFSFITSLWWNSRKSGRSNFVACSFWYSIDAAIVVVLFFDWYFCYTSLLFICNTLLLLFIYCFPQSNNH